MNDVDVVVPFRSGGDRHRERSWQWVERWWRAHFPDWGIITADSGHEPFNRGASRNAAVRRSTADVVIIADADTIPDAGAVQRGHRMVTDGQAPWVIPYDGDGKTRTGSYYNLTERATMERLRFPPDPYVMISEPWDTDDYEHKLCSWAGCLIVRRVDYWAAGGYPELTEWGYEDDCFRTALDMMAGNHVRTHGFCLHLWHEVTEEQRFGNPGIEANRAVFLEYKKARTQQQMDAVIDRHGHRA